MPQKTALSLLAFALVMLMGVLLWQPANRAGAGRSSAPTGCEKRSFEGSTETAGGGGLMLSLGLGELSDRSARVVSGTIRSFRTCLDPETREPVTSVTLDVTQHVKSPSRHAAPSEITFDVPGGRIGNIVMAVGTMPQFTAGEEIVVFLQPTGDGRLRLTEDFQGKFSVEDGSVERAGQRLDAFIETVGKAVDGEPVDDPLAGVSGTIEVAYTTTGFKWYSFPVDYYLNPTANMPNHLAASAVESAWNNGFNSWAADPLSNVDFASNGITTRTSDTDVCGGFTAGDGYNDVTWGFSEAQGSSTLAVTRSCGTGISPPYQLTDSDIEFDNGTNGAGWRTDGTGPCGSPTFDLESVALHEIGHLLGLGHPTSQSCPGSQCPVMNTMYVGVKRTPCQDDANGLASLYPAGTPAPTSTATTANTPTNTRTPTAPGTPTNTGTPTPTRTHTATSPAAATATATNTSVPTNTATSPATPTNTAVATNTTPIANATSSPTMAATNTSPPTPTNTVAPPTNAPSPTATVDAPASTATATRTPTATRTSTRTPTRTRTATPVSDADGDVSDDGNVTSVDALLILQYSAELAATLPDLASGDVNDSGHVDSIDSALVLQFSAGLLNRLPVTA